MASWTGRISLWCEIMASKKEMNRQKRRDKEWEYTRSFLARLAQASTVGAAIKVAKQAMPTVNEMGRRRHTNLIHVLEGIEAKGVKPPFRVLRDYPLAPNKATSEERVGYAALFERLARSGEISAEDASYAIQILTSPSQTFVDFI
jgi:hypothetical protein